MIMQILAAFDRMQYTTTHAKIECKYTTTLTKNTDNIAAQVVSTTCNNAGIRHSAIISELFMVYLGILLKVYVQGGR